MQPAWVQAIISAIAIIASACIAVFVPWWQRRIEAKRMNRRRLSVATTYNAPSGLTLRVAYQPEFEHIGIRARVRLLNPTDTVLHSGKFVHSAGMLADGTHALAQMDGPCLDSIALLQLVDVSGQGFLSGVVYLMPSSEVGLTAHRISQAQIKVEILTDSGEGLLSVKLPVSAVNPPEAFKAGFSAVA